jgi:carbon storage regulator
MLVLSRRVGERIQIGADITVTVVRLVEGTVRLGIEAPAHMPILRQELLTGQQEAPPRPEQPVAAKPR